MKLPLAYAALPAKGHNALAAFLLRASNSRHCFRCSSCCCPIPAACRERGLNTRCCSQIAHTLTVEGSVLGSFITARNIVVRGKVEKTVESGTRINNVGGVGEGLSTTRIPASRPVVGFTPYPFNYGR
jgi:hypothetical protein